MNVPVPHPDRELTVFYGGINSYNSLTVERAIDFEADCAEKWCEPEEVIAEEQMEAYTTLCRLAIGTTTRIIYLPRETTLTKGAFFEATAGRLFRPAETFLKVDGNNFSANLDMGEGVSIRKYGLAHNGRDCPYFEVGRSASVSCHVTIEDTFYLFDIGPQITLMYKSAHMDTPQAIKKGTTPAPLEAVDSLINDVLKPLEDDIKAQCYEWTGGGKTDKQFPRQWTDGETTWHVSMGHIPPTVSPDYL